MMASEASQPPLRIVALLASHIDSDERLTALGRCLQSIRSQLHGAPTLALSWSAADPGRNLGKAGTLGAFQETTVHRIESAICAETEKRGERVEAFGKKPFGLAINNRRHESCKRRARASPRTDGLQTVSYTHLTLPTICSV